MWRIQNSEVSLFDDVDLQMNGTQVKRVQSFKYLGVTMNGVGRHILVICSRSYRSSPVCV